MGDKMPKRKLEKDELGEIKGGRRAVGMRKGARKGLRGTKKSHSRSAGAQKKQNVAKRPGLSGVGKFKGKRSIR